MSISYDKCKECGCSVSDWDDNMAICMNCRSWYCSKHSYLAIKDENGETTKCKYCTMKHFNLGDKVLKFIFDVESNGLYGEGFAYGVVVYNTHTNQIIYKESLLSEEGLEQAKSNLWLVENVLPNLKNMETVKTNKDLRNRFYSLYMDYKDHADIISDVNYPVETNFLNQIVQDDLANRQWNMPYPLYDIASVVPISISRIETVKNKVKDLKEHNPLDDVIASLYTWLSYCKEEG